MPRFASTTTPLGANDQVVLDLFANREDNIVGSVYADQPGTIFIEQSADGQNWDISSEYTIAADDGKGFGESVVFSHARVRYVNGPTDQGVFRLTARFSSTGYRG